MQAGSDSTGKMPPRIDYKKLKNNGAANPGSHFDLAINFLSNLLIGSILFLLESLLSLLHNKLDFMRLDKFEKSDEPKSGRVLFVTHVSLFEAYILHFIGFEFITCH